jgi:beta-N-acetylglucosaminidase
LNYSFLSFPELWQALQLVRDPKFIASFFHITSYDRTTIRAGTNYDRKEPRD